MFKKVRITFHDDDVSRAKSYSLITFYLLVNRHGLFCKGFEKLKDPIQLKYVKQLCYADPNMLRNIYKNMIQWIRKSAKQEGKPVKDIELNKYKVKYMKCWYYISMLAEVKRELKYTGTTA